MQQVSFENIGSMLHMIRFGNPQAAPPIHLWTKSDPKCYSYLGIIEYCEFVKAGKSAELPEAVFIIASDMLRGDGPFSFYWIADEKDPELISKRDEWKRKFLTMDAQEIINMGIGNIHLCRPLAV